MKIKKFIIILLALCLVFSMAAVAVPAAATIMAVATVEVVITLHLLARFVLLPVLLQLSNFTPQQVLILLWNIPQMVPLGKLLQ